MLEEKDLTSEQRVRLECVDLVVRVAEMGTMPAKLIRNAKEIEEYVLNG